MQVVFTHQHLYKNLDPTHIDSDMSAAIAGFDSSCSTISKDGGTYTASVKLDKCNTAVSQTGGKIVFENSFTGNIDALTVQGIIMTKVLAFPVSCTYDESFTLELNPLHLQGSDIDITGISNNGTFGNYFDMIAYHDAGFAQEITSDDAIVIGEPVYVRIFELENIPTNIDYYLTDCTGSGLNSQFLLLNYSGQSLRFHSNFCFFLSAKKHLKNSTSPTKVASISWTKCATTSWSLLRTLSLSVEVSDRALASVLILPLLPLKDNLISSLW